MRVLVLGANGMIGSAIYRTLLKVEGLRVSGTARCIKSVESLPVEYFNNMIFKYNIEQPEEILELINFSKPQIIINCIGVTKHVQEGTDAVKVINMNALLPQRLKSIVTKKNIRLIHISTDCVFSGQKGNYNEGDIPDAMDLYGKSKNLGEVLGDGVLTLRTSIIGHENNTKYGLLEWFLTQKKCIGYSKALFSGLTTLEFAKIIRDYVIPNQNMSGLFHVGGDLIDKFSLLKIISQVYKHKIEIQRDEKIKIDRSLNSTMFQKYVGYTPPNWISMILEMNKYNYEELGNV